MIERETERHRDRMEFFWKKKRKTMLVNNLFRILLYTIYYLFCHFYSQPFFILLDNISVVAWYVGWFVCLSIQFHLLYVQLPFGFSRFISAMYLINETTSTKTEEEEKKNAINNRPYNYQQEEKGKRKRVHL